MPLVINDLEVASIGNIMQSRFSIDFSGLYTTGGISISPQLIGLSRIRFFEVIGNDQGLIFDFDYTNEKIKISDAGSASLSFVGDPLANHTHGFSGNVLPTHNHQLVSAFKSTVIKTIRLYVITATIVGGPFTNGETVTGGTSGNTAVISSQLTIDIFTALTVTVPTGNFTLGETITGGTSGATGQVSRPLVNNWSMTPEFNTAAIIEGVSTSPLLNLIQVSGIAPPTAGAFRFVEFSGFAAIETARVDAVVSLSATGINGLVSSATAGTPTGTNASVSAGTPSGAISGSSAFAEIPNGTDISTLNQVECLVLGYG